MTFYHYFGRLRLLSEVEKKGYTILGLTLFSLVVFGAFAIRPAAMTVISLSKSVAEGEEVNLKLEEKIANLSLLEGKFAENKEDIPIVYQSLPKDDDLANLVRELSLFGGESKAVLRRFSASAPKNFPANPKVKILPVAATFDGELEGFLSLFEWFEMRRRMVEIDSAKINSNASQEEGAASMTVEVSFSLFYMPAEVSEL